MSWPGLDDNITNVMQTCTSCQATRSSPLVAQLHPWEWPSQPWSILHIDFAGPPMGKMFLVIVDTHSKWLDVQVMKSIATKTIKKLKILFASFGSPKKIVSDNGPTVTSEDFTNEWNMAYDFSTVPLIY